MLLFLLLCALFQSSCGIGLYPLGGTGTGPTGNQAAPPNPTGISAATYSPSKIRVSWSSQGGSTAGYVVAYQAGATAPADCNSGTVISSPSTTRAIISLLANTQYSMRVCARNGNSPPDLSSGVTVTQTTTTAAHVQSKAADVGVSAAGATVAATWDSNTTSGNAVIACVSWGTPGNTVSVADTQGNIYTLIDSYTNTINTQRSECYYARNIVGGTTPTVTATFSGLSVWRALVMHEISGVSATSPLGGHRVQIQDAPPSTADGATSATDAVTNGSYVMGFSSLDGTSGSTATAGTGFSLDEEEIRAATQNFTSEHLIQSGNGRRAATFFPASTDTRVTFVVELRAADTDPLDPPDPTGLNATANSTSQIGLSWTSGGGSTSDFVVAYQLGATAPADCQTGTVATSSSTSLAVSGLASGRQYSFRVCARDANLDLSVGVSITKATLGLGHLQQAAADVGSAVISSDVLATFDYDTVAGSTIVACASWGTPAATVSLSDSQGNTYVLIDDVTDGANNQRGACYYALNATGAKNLTVTATYSGAVPWRAIVLHEITGGDGVAPLGSHVAQLQAAPTTATDAVTSGTAAVLDGSYIFGLSLLTGTNGESSTPGTGFTLGAEENRINVQGFTTEYLIQSGNATRAATFTAPSTSARITFMAEIVE